MTKNKHDHTATKKIKAWLFAIILLLPFLFLLPTGLYYGLNQNAQLSERTEQQPVYYQSNEITSNNDIIVGNIYKWIDNYTTTITGYTPCFNLEYNNMLEGNCRIYIDNQVMYLTNGTTYINLLQKEIYFVPSEIYSLPSNLYSSITFTDIEVIKGYTPVVYNNDISTSIINAWNSTWQNPLFSWTNYSPFYAPMQSFTNVFGINDMQIANVLTYLATITAIYIVFDIIIELFTYLTHLIPRSD